MIRQRSGSRERASIRVSAEDHMHLERMRDILLAEPCRGVPTEPHRLLDHMYIGNQSNAESLRLLRRLGITHVVNCAGYKGPRQYPEVSPYEGLGIDYLEFKADDNDFYHIIKHFHEAFSFLDRVHRRGGRALVHCAMGINRSAATCIGYMMHHKNWSLCKVLKIIKDKRRVVLSNKGFQLQLIGFARNVGCLDELELPTSRTRELPREVHHVTRAYPDLPPRGLPPSSNHIPPRIRRRQPGHQTYMASPQKPSRPTVSSNYVHSNSLSNSTYRRNSFESTRCQRNSNGVDLLNRCINNTLRISGPRAGSVDRIRTPSRAY